MQTYTLNNAFNFFFRGKKGFIESKMWIDRISLIISILAALAQGTPIEISGDAAPEVYTPIPIISQTDTSSPDGSFSYR